MSETATVDKVESRGPKPRNQLPRKPFGQISVKTKLAKEYFLHGKGDGKPITCAARLAELVGIHPGTVEKWRPAWERERKAVALATVGKNNNGGQITGETLAAHAEMVMQLKTEMERLHDLLPKLTAGSEAHRDTLKLYTATSKAWTEESGVRSHFETATAWHKEMARTAARATKHSGFANDIKEAKGFDFSIENSSADPLESLL